MALTSSCEDGGIAVDTTDISGTYSYRQFDTTGVQTSSGTLLLRRQDSHLTGQFNIVGSSQVDSIEGSVIEPDTIEFHSHPRRVVLNYALWRGTRDDGIIQGEVFSSRYNPPTIPLRNGTFLAVKVNN